MTTFDDNGFVFNQRVIFPLLLLCEHDAMSCILLLLLPFGFFSIFFLLILAPVSSVRDD